MEQIEQIGQAIDPITNLVEEWINDELSNGEEVIEIIASSETRAELSDKLKDYLWECLNFSVSIRKNDRDQEFINNLLKVVLTNYVQWEVIEDCYFKWELIRKEDNSQMKTRLLVRPAEIEKRRQSKIKDRCRD